jgi:hypothetical protein
MATIINRTVESALSREGERFVKKNLELELERIGSRHEREKEWALTPIVQTKAWAEPSSWEKSPLKGVRSSFYSSTGVVFWTPQRVQKALKTLEKIWFLEGYSSGVLTLGESLAVQAGLGMESRAKRAWLSGSELAKYAPELGWAWLARLCTIQVVTEVYDTFVTTEPYFGALVKELGLGAEIVTRLNPEKIQELREELLKKGREFFPDFVWEEGGIGSVVPGSPTALALAKAEAEAEKAKTEAKAKAEAELARIKSSLRVWTRYGGKNAGGGWVIRPDGSLREPDVIDTSMFTSGNKRCRQASEGDFVWFEIQPDELALVWRKAFTAAPHECRVIARPPLLTPAQVERVKEVEGDLEARYRGKVGLASREPSPSIGDGWGLAHPKKVEEPASSAEEIDYTSPMAKAFMKALEKKGK